MGNNIFSVLTTDVACDTNEENLGRHCLLSRVLGYVCDEELCAGLMFVVPLATSFILSSRSHSLTPDPPGWQFSAVCKRSVYS